MKGNNAPWLKYVRQFKTCKSIDEANSYILRNEGWAIILCHLGEIFLGKLVVNGRPARVEDLNLSSEAHSPLSIQAQLEQYHQQGAQIEGPTQNQEAPQAPCRRRFPSRNGGLGQGFGRV